MRPNYLLAAMCLPGLAKEYWQRLADHLPVSLEALLSSRIIPWEQVDELAACLIAQAIDFVSIESEDYPERLREIPDPPLGLFIKGNKSLLKERQIAIVGSRKATQAALTLAKQWAGELVVHGVVVTSGMAIGIDAAAHAGALVAGKTIAVLGCGLNYSYPKQNAGLMKAIVAHGGAVISEYLPDVAAQAAFFPQRNRIISGLSEGVLVVEAARKSGTLITARLASEQGRDVFAIPGHLANPNTAGCHYLIQQGAKLVTSVSDIVEDYNTWVVAPENSRLSPEEARVLGAMCAYVVAIDELVMNSGLAFGELCSILLELEFRGLVKKMPGGYQKLTDMSKL